MQNKVNEVLKMQREQKHLSLQSVHQETRISMSYLDALESGQWNVFPAEVYLIGFLRKYASCLGLNPEEMILLYKKEIEAVQKKQQDEIQKEVMAKKEEESQSILKGIVLLVLIFLFGGWWLYTVMVSPGDEKKKVSPADLRKKFSRSSFVQGELLSLEVQATGMVWVRIAADGKLAYEGFLSSGTARSWNASNEIFVRVGDTRYVHLSLNGQAIDARGGSKGGVNELLLNYQSLNEGSRNGPSNPVESVGGSPKLQGIASQSVRKSTEAESGRPLPLRR